MSVTRDPNSLYGLTEWTEEVLRVPNQYGFIKSKGYFDTDTTGQTAVIFDKSQSTTTLLPRANRGQRSPSVGKDRSVETFSIALPFFKHEEYITPEDLQGQRMVGTPESPETLANARAIKFEDGRRSVDQTHEYMMIQAIKGNSIDPEGNTLANMFSLFNITQEQIDFAFSLAATEVYNLVSQIKRYVQANILTGSTIQGVDVFCAEDWFDDFITHPSVKEAYLNWQSNARYREEFSDYFDWGISDVFVYNGVRFMTYPAVFVKPDGTTEKAIADGEAHVVPRARGMFRGYYGPNDKLTGANQRGSEMFAFEYRDPRDEFHEIMFETAPLFFATNPKVLVKLTKS